MMEQTEDTAAAYGLAGALIDPDSGEWAAGTQQTVAYGGRRGNSAERYYSGLLHQAIWWTAVAWETATAGSGQQQQQQPTEPAGTSRGGVAGEDAAELALRCKARYQKAIEGMRRLLVRRSSGPHKLWYVGELLQGRKFLPAFSSLSCGLSGTLALGHIHGMDDTDSSHLLLAKRLAESCVRLGRLTASGLPPDVTWLNGRPKLHEDAVEWFVPPETENGRDQHQQQLEETSDPEAEASSEQRRQFMQSGEVIVAPDEHASSSTLGPAIAQSLYWLHRATGDSLYVEWGWEHFTALERSGRLPRPDAGYATVADVTRTLTVNASSSAAHHRDETKDWVLSTFKWLWMLQQQAGEGGSGGDDSGDGGGSKDVESDREMRDVVPTSTGHLLQTAWGYS